MAFYNFLWINEWEILKCGLAITFKSLPQSCSELTMQNRMDRKFGINFANCMCETSSGNR